MLTKRLRFHIGLRTAKTAAAVVLSMIIVHFYGATTSKLIFAMLGAMAAVQPTFSDSLESCLTQIVGVLFGAIISVLLLALPLHSLVATGIGILMVITLYNTLHIRFSPSLPCFIVVMMCTTPDIQPISHALGRIWDTAIGLSVGMLINTLIFPYDNSRQIHTTVESLNREVIIFLEDMFDGDDVLPDADKITKQIDAMARQLTLFSKQKLILRLRRQQEQIHAFQECQRMARQLLAHMEVLSQMGRTGRLTLQNRKRLMQNGADIRDQRMLDNPQELDIVTNFHVEKILSIRRDMLDTLEKHAKKETV